MTCLLTLEGLSKAFGGNRVLQDFNLGVRRGEILGLLGPNGSGKSTLLDIITGFTPADAGRILLNNENIASDQPHVRAKKGVRRTFQLPSMPEKMTVLEVLMVSEPSRTNLWSSLVRGPAYRAAEARCLEKARELLQLLNLSAVGNNRARDLSGGQTKLLSIGVALMDNPSLLLLDEPTAGIHPNVRSALVEILKNINAQGITIGVVEHDMRFINMLCDRCVVLDRGELIADCRPADLSSHPRVVQAYLGSSPDTNSRSEAFAC